MTVQEFIKRLQEYEKIRDVQVSERILIAGANAMYASMLDRIFDEGKATNEQLIQKGYRWQKNKYTREDFQGVKGAGFSPNTTVKDKKTGKEEPAMYIPGGYAGFRRLAGRQTEYVDLSLTGSLMGNIKVGKDGNDVVIGLSSLKEVKKKDKMEALYKKPIFKPSANDIQEAKDAMLAEIKFMLTNNRN